MARKRPVCCYDGSEKEWTTCARCEYVIVLILSIISLVAASAITAVWVIFYKGGIELRYDEFQFNLHPMMMVAGSITLSGFSILLYRLCPCVAPARGKFLHLLFQVLAIPFVGIGFLSVYNTLENKAHFQSLHTWLGLLTLGLFTVHFSVGFFSFIILCLCPTRTYNCRSVMVPFHASFGLAIFMCAITTCLTGIIEYEQHKNENELVKLLNIEFLERHISKLLGMVLVVLGYTASAAVRRINAPARARLYIRESYE